MKGKEGVQGDYTTSQKNFNKLRRVIVNLTIVDVKYEEIQRMFTTIRNDQALVVGALAIERLWQPFVNGISKCSYSEQEREDVVRPSWCLSTRP